VKLEHTNVIEVRVSARAGSAIGDCLREAILIAVEEWRNVVLVHNNVSYRVCPNDLIASVDKEKE